ncbi:MAG: hypothetical protein KC519_18655 [Anaerolineae bacterium]|nr:hypothetical protein [Anaerolineae bacterium]
MKHLNRLWILGLLALVFLLVIPASAQDQGNIITRSTFGSGPINFNPVTSSSSDEQEVMNRLYPNLLGVDPVTALITPGAPGGMAESWDISDDGTVYTFHLREGFAWSDGTPVTARDFEYTWDAIASGETESPLAFLLDNPVVDFEALDDYTLKVTFTSADCEALNSAGLQPVPAHVFESGPFSALNDYNADTPDALEVGPYQLASQITDQQTGLIPATWDDPDGNAQNEGWIMRVFGDQTVEFEAFLAGETTALDFIAPNRRSDVVAAQEAGSLNVYTYSPGDRYDYLAFNLADPNNPQNAYDENGNLIEQTPNMFFGDVRVRQALNMAVDVDAIIEGAVFGFGSRMSSSYAPGSWPYDPSVSTYEYNPERALELLAEAGWIDHDNDPSTPLIAQGAMYAPDGTEFAFSLLTNQGNTRRNAIGTITQDELSRIGIKVDFQSIDFNVLIEILDQQTFDTVILGWQNSYPFRADQRQIFGSTGDVIGGSNAGSYINPELDTLFAQASEVPNCDVEARKAIYGQIQQILRDDAPYLWMYSLDGMYSWDNTVNGVEPYPGTLYWNVQDWTRSS